ncbi:MAG: DUF2852 domain-containing protein [Rhizobiales bacterium]|nr:DUF2852 domain-containing protein [Hyphomicrobiales bacterium]NRB15940.1 DUF2852 domain-containing protein [Hyphomicrobiales bacterium]
MNHSTAHNNYNSNNSNNNWRLPNIAFMVGGFMLFAPVGFAILAWLVIGKNVDILGTVKSKFINSSPAFKQQFKSKRHYGHTGNSAFDEYKHDSIARLEEEMQRRKAQLKDEENNFNEFVTNLQKSKDQAEFNQFMKAQTAAANAAEKAQKTSEEETV